jgi:phosphoribosylformimino-5-aminoimidazole carboxamide ribotide isomerase
MVQLIPSMDLLNGRVVRLLHGDFDKVTHYELDPLAWVEQLIDAGATRLHLVDLDGAFGLARQPHFIAYPRVFPKVRFQLGGGLRSREAVQRVLDAGFDPVVGTLAVEQPRQLAGLPGDRLICALDVKGDRIATKGWTAESVCESTDVFESLLTLGFSRALVTDIRRDGSLEGPGMDATRWIASEGFQVQASGGLRDLEDLSGLSGIPNVVGAISGKALLEGRIPLEAPETRLALSGSRKSEAGSR